MLYTPENAEALAAKLNKEEDHDKDAGKTDDVWTYVVIHPPVDTKGLSFIEVRDGDDEYVGTL